MSRNFGLVELGHRNYYHSIPGHLRQTCQPSRWQFHSAPHQRDLTGRASLMRGLKVPRVTSLTSITTWSPFCGFSPVSELPRGCFFVSRPLRLPSPALLTQV